MLNKCLALALLVVALGLANAGGDHKAMCTETIMTWVCKGDPAALFKDTPECKTLASDGMAAIKPSCDAFLADTKNEANMKKVCEEGKKIHEAKKDSYKNCMDPEKMKAMKDKHGK